jgi:multidrug resistance protein
MSLPAFGANSDIAVSPHQRTWRFAALLASLSMLGPFAIDMYLPAFTAISREFDASPIAVQQTLSAYLFAYAFMMLWHGSLSDALGRRPIVLGGLVIYALASLGCAISGNIESLWLFRTLQGVSAGSGLVVGRAIIRDRYQGPEAQRLMSQITLVFGIAPALAPVVGGAVLNLLGWRAIFSVMLAFTIGVFVWAARRLPETLPRTERQSLRLRALWEKLPGGAVQAGVPAACSDSLAQFRRVLHLYRERTRIPLAARREHVGLCLAVRADDRRHYGRCRDFRPCCRSTPVARNDRYRLRVHVRGGAGEPARCCVRTAVRALARPANLGVHAQEQSRHA